MSAAYAVSRGLSLPPTYWAELGAGGLRAQLQPLPQFLQLDLLVGKPGDLEVAEWGQARREAPAFTDFSQAQCTVSI